MAEQILVDYLKKARVAGQSDEQTRALLYKNGWTELEVSDAVASLNQSQPASQPQTQQPQAEVTAQPRVQTQVQEQAQPQQPQNTTIETRINTRPRTIAQVQTQSKVPQDNMPQIKAKSHIFLKLLIVLIMLVVLGGAGWYVGGQYLNLPWKNSLNFFSIFQKDNSEVIGKMFINMKDVKSYRTAVQGEISDNLSKNKIILNVTGDSDMTDVTEPKSQSTFVIDLIAPSSSIPAVVANINLITIGGTSYFEIENINLPDIFSSFLGTNISQFLGKWLRVDNDSTAVLSTAMSDSFGTGDIAQVNNSDLTSTIQNILLTENLISVDKQLDDEIVGGQSRYHFLTKISKDKLKVFLTKVIALSDNNEAVMESSVNSFADAIGDTNVEMWIGKEDYLLYKFSINKTIDLSKIYTTANTQLELKFNVTNSNFNTPVVIQAPEGSQKIEEVILPLLKVQKIGSDINQIGLIANLSFATNNTYATLCNRGLLNGYLTTYGENLVNLHTDIVSQGAKKPACFSDAQDYCVSTQLADGNYICVNKAGILGSTRCVSAKTTCK